VREGKFLNVDIPRVGLNDAFGGLGGREVLITARKSKSRHHPVLFLLCSRETFTE
jgi:hypothetical protein